jgi:hypothetical protein
VGFKAHESRFLYFFRNKEGIMAIKPEREFQRGLIKELKERFPGCIATKVETYLQGFPDLLVLYKKNWALLECKRSEDATRQPNQDYYVELADKMSFARFIYPENKEEVLNELQRAFEPER